MNEFTEEHAKMDARLYLRNTLAYLNQTWCAITTMIWGYLHSFGKAPPSGQEFWKCIFWIITSEQFGQKSQDWSIYFRDDMPSWKIPNIPISAIINVIVKNSIFYDKIHNSWYGNIGYLSTCIGVFMNSSVSFPECTWKALGNSNII